MGHFSHPQLRAGEVRRGDEERVWWGPTGVVTVTVYSIQAGAASGKRTSPLLINRESVAALANGLLCECPIHFAPGGRAEGALKWVCLSSRRERLPCSLSAPLVSQPLPLHGCSGWAAGDWLAFACFQPYSLPCHLQARPHPPAILSSLVQPPPSCGLSSLPPKGLVLLSLGLILPSCPIHPRAGCWVPTSGDMGSQAQIQGSPVAGGVPF